MRKLLFSFLIVILGLSLLAPTALAQGGRLSGTLNDENGEPIAGGVIILENSTASKPRIEQTVDDNGRFSIVGLKPGRWEIAGAAEGYQGSPGFMNIKTGSNTPADMILERIKHPLVARLGDEAFVGLDPVAIELEITAADEAYNTSQWQIALDGYTAILAKLPMLNDLNLRLGDIHRSLENYEAAIMAFEAGLAGDPNLENLISTEIGRTRMAMGDFSGASDSLASAAAGSSAAREDLYNLGEVEFAKGDIDAAAVWYEKAVALDPAWAKPLFKLALVALNKGDMDTAKNFFTQVVEKEPDSDEAAQAQATLDALP
jgi:tetratricopeptide (TPR) repeat protein